MANSETSVTVIEPTAALQVNLDAWPEEQFNRLLPVQTLGLSTDLIKPVIQAVVAQPAASDGKSPDHYSSPDIPSGRRALTKRFLDALASAAGVDFTSEQRLDDGSEPMVCGVQVKAEMLLPTGRRITTTGTKWVDMRRMPWKDGVTGAQAGKFKATIYEHTASRARNRAIRALLSLQQSYSIEELRKPFAVMSFVPNMDHPEIRSRILDAMAPAIAATYGPASARQLSAGDVVEVAEADDDDAFEGQARDVTPEAPAAAGDDLPDWAKPVQPETVEKSKAGKKEPTLVERLQQSADVSELQGSMTEPQKARLGALIGQASELEWSTEVVPVLRAAFGEAWVPADMTAAQAQSISNLADAYAAADPVIDFTEAWRAAAAGARKAAAA